MRLSGNKIMSGCIPTSWRSIPPTPGGYAYEYNDLYRLGLPYCDTPEASAPPAPPVTISGGSGTASDPYIISDPFSVSSRSIRSYMFAWHMEHYVYFQWDVGNHAGEWAVSIDATPASHVFDLFGRDDQGDTWDDTDGNWRSGDASIIISVQSGGHVYIRIKSRDEFNYPPIGLTLTIRPPALADVTEQTATATPTPTSTPAASTSTPTATPTIASSPFTSGGSGTSSDPYIISDPTSVSSRSIRSYFSDIQARQSVYFRWDVGGDRFGRWSISIEASPSSHDFDLFGRDDRDDQIGEWDDYGTSNSGDEEIILYMLGQGHIILRVRNYDGGAPTDLTLSISPPTAAGSAVPIAGQRQLRQRRQRQLRQRRQRQLRQRRQRQLRQPHRRLRLSHRLVNSRPVDRELSPIRTLSMTRPACPRVRFAATYPA